MKKIIDYMVVSEKGHRFKSEIKDKIAEGWTPLGGVAISAAGYEVYYYQALVKYAIK